MDDLSLHILYLSLYLAEKSADHANRTKVDEKDEVANPSSRCLLAEFAQVPRAPKKVRNRLRGSQTQGGL
jgi:hypothetical protein